MRNSNSDRFRTFTAIRTFVVYYYSLLLYSLLLFVCTFITLRRLFDEYREETTKQKKTKYRIVRENRLYDNDGGETENRVSPTDDRFIGSGSFPIMLVNEIPVHL